MKIKLKTVVVNNSININKTNNRLQHQIIEHKIDLEMYRSNPDAGLGQPHKCGFIVFGYD